MAEACVACHNNHKDTPKRDFKLDDVMGGVVV
ncbi:MAG: c-type heme family protein, partial [Gammaproteobacteria bacterium]